MIIEARINKIEISSVVLEVENQKSKVKNISLNDD